MAHAKPQFVLALKILNLIEMKYNFLLIRWRTRMSDALSSASIVGANWMMIKVPSRIKMKTLVLQKSQFWTKIKDKLKLNSLTSIIVIYQFLKLLRQLKRSIGMQMRWRRNIICMLVLSTNKLKWTLSVSNKYSKTFMNNINLLNLGRNETSPEI